MTQRSGAASCAASAEPVRDSDRPPAMTAAKMQVVKRLVLGLLETAAAAAAAVALLWLVLAAVPELTWLLVFSCYLVLAGTATVVWVKLPRHRPAALGMVAGPVSIFLYAYVLLLLSPLP